MTISVRWTGGQLSAVFVKSWILWRMFRSSANQAAASAFFAYNFRQMTKKNFEGNILLVDYGGGTLDITLTNVAADDGDSVEIKVLERTGAGENEEGKVGKAGIVYMETVMGRSYPAGRY